MKIKCISDEPVDELAPMGHNDPPDDETPDDAPRKVRSGFAADQLKSLIERVERLEEEKAAIAADIREVYGEAKGHGFDTKIMRQIVALRRLDSADWQEIEAIKELYMAALGMR